MASATVRDQAAVRDAQIAIIGAGFSGLGMAIRLKQAGIEDFVVLERADDVGGTWQANTYPGCQCDVPSHLYSFSFALNPDWSRTFSFQQEIWDYLRDCTRRYELEPHLRLSCEVTAADWDDERSGWRLQTGDGPLTAQVLIGAMGGLSEPAIPALPGLDRFAGKTFHTAAWDHDHNLRGGRLAIVGTGASAIQVIPAVQSQVAALKVFQRTPSWVMPHPDRPLSRFERRLYRRVPGLQRLMRGGIYWARETFVVGFMHPALMGLGERIARTHLRHQVADHELRRQLAPSYRMGCKRVLLSNDYYPALQQPNVELVTEAIAEIRPHAIVTADGSEHEVDTIAFGTGFHVTDTPAAQRVRGRGGQLLAEAWNGSPRAYCGTTVAGFPNMFMLLGPNTGLGHNSVVFMAEAQIAYVLDALRAMRARRIETLEVRPERQQRFVDQVAHKLRGSVWQTGGCASWYLDVSGRNATIWPGTSWSFRQRVRRFDLGAYDFRIAKPSPAQAKEAVAA